MKNERGGNVVERPVEKSRNVELLYRSVNPGGPPDDNSDTPPPKRYESSLYQDFQNERGVRN